ncbi:hypothetical protein N5A93_06365 [Roseovarius sp. EGI FJ00037]|uniref:hypothetical protein n=1 Tax=Roseovarius salincola TaxID=2978479 RepID=UPI0022A80BEE|nr:hypothetical protein [Roseovarius sp. EGI FJ00037]MCZ0811849.1 hypothetical protein [Roseovarius sp. EGI FJ00037]
MAHNYVSQTTLDARVADAISRAHDVFLRANSPNNFYFHDFLNVFITLIQQPAIFVLYRQAAGDVLERHYILSRDKGFYSGLLDHLTEEEPENNPEKLFSIFPSASDFASEVEGEISSQRTKYFLLISKVMGSAQEKKYERVKPLEGTQQIASNPFDYIALCAKKFFDTEWAEYPKSFQVLAYDYLQRSMTDLVQGHINRSARPEEDPETANLPAPSLQTAWNKKLSSDLSPLFDGLTARLSYLTEMASIRAETEETDEDAVGPRLSNFFLATRAYTRPTSRRPFTSKAYEKSFGYKYDVRFIIPRKQEDELMNFFIWLKSSANNSKLTKYSSASLGRKYLKQRKILEEEFFSILRGPDGPREILNIYTSKIGDHARSFTDPIFETGLIDFRDVFEDGGLARVPGLISLRTTGSLSAHSDVQDGLRIVAAHYVFSQMARRALGQNGTGRVKMILIPIMERGTVWAVSGHFYHANQNESFPIYDNRIWQAVFHLSNYIRSIIRRASSELLWEDFSHLIVNTIAQFDSRALQNAANLGASLKALEDKAKAHGRLNPLGFPAFRESGGILYCFPNPNQNSDPVEIRGITESNAFFQSVQNWGGVEERDYSRAIDEGMNALYNRVALERMNRSRPLSKAQTRKAR